MSEQDLKAIIEAYQRKSFELFNQNIVLEVQISSLNNQINQLHHEIDLLKKGKKPPRAGEDFS